MIDFLKEARSVQDWIIEQRRWLHRHPEHGYQEFRTSEHICGVLKDLGMDSRRMAGTGVVADLAGGKPGPIIGLRADMDALPVQEQTDLPFASEHPGMMHACGHDMHMAAVLGAAKILAAHRDELPGTVRFLFQPDEEFLGGAARMIEEGCLDGVSQVYGAHVRQELPLGSVGICPGPYYAANNPYKITLRGRGSHGAEPHNGTDVIVAGAAVVQALQTVVSRRMPPTEPAVITVGNFHAGSQNNIIPSEAVLEGMMRSFGEASRKRLADHFRSVVEGVAAAMGVEAEIEIRWAHPGVVNHKAQAELVRQAVETVLGPEFAVEDHASMVSEDFGCFIQDLPGCFYHIGVGGPAGLHSPHFCPEEWPLANAAAVHAQVLWDAMTKG